MINPIILPIKRLSEIIAHHLLISYVSGTIVGIIIMVFLFLSSGGNIIVISDELIVILTIAIATAAIKFISGFGISITYMLICTLILRLFRAKIKGNRRNLSLVKGLLLIIAIGILSYGIFVFYTALVAARGLGYLETLACLVGIWILVFVLYILPVFQQKFNPLEEDDEGMRQSLGRFKYSLWKGYQHKIKKDYGKVMAAEAERFRDSFVEVRIKLSGFLLLPIFLTWVIMPPVFLVAVILWLRIFALERRPYTVIERLFLIIIIVGNLGISSLILYSSLLDSQISSLLNISYALGILTSLLIMLYIVLKN